jgi:hypothetical protein
MTQEDQDDRISIYFIHDGKTCAFVSFNYKNNHFSILQSSETKFYYEWDNGLQHPQLKFL